MVSAVDNNNRIGSWPPLETMSPAVSGVGFHYFPDTQHYRSEDLDTWLPELNALGARWITLRGEIQRAIPENFLVRLIDAGITPIVHIPVSPIRALDSDDLDGMLCAYSKWGVKYVVVFDRPNMRESWAAGEFEGEKLVERFVDYWLGVAHRHMHAGLQPVLSPLQQGGTYWDTSFLSAVLQTLIEKGEDSVLDRMCIALYSYAFGHPPDWGRGGSSAWPASKPYQTPPGSQDQRGFWSFDWYGEVLMEVLGRIPEMIMIAGGARRSEINANEGEVMELAWHTTCNTSIARAMHSGHLPATLLNTNFWVMVSSMGTEDEKDCWYSVGGKSVPAVDELKSLATISANAGRQGERSYFESLRPVKVLRHYVLLPNFDWGRSEWHWDAAGPYVRQEGASCGYSVDAALQAEKVTIVGGEDEIGYEVVHQLEQAGCIVTRIKDEMMVNVANHGGLVLEPEKAKKI